MQLLASRDLYVYMCVCIYVEERSFQIWAVFVQMFITGGHHDRAEERNWPIYVYV
jgi:hypothetical protein